MQFSVWAVFKRHLRNGKETCMMDNVSVINMLTLSGLSGTRNYRVTLFVLTLLCYFVIWLVNVTIIVTIIVDKTLHEPMYIYLCNLCINGLYGTVGFYPKFLCDLLSATHVISYAGCLLQGFVLHSSAGADFSILALMAYDRYVAICRLLVYHTVMTKQRICIFVFIAWLIPFYLLFMSTITTSASRLCGSHIPKIYCVNWLISNLACSASIARIIIPAFNYTFYFGHVIFVVWSYIHLIKTCQSSKENTSKFMQTCVPHLFSLIVVVGSLLFDLLYMRFGRKELSQNVQNFMAMEFLVIPPIVNPVMYGLKLTQIRKRIFKFICSRSSL
ncbi:olfactory receptor 49-like [Acanthochromis polyacanthus]|uniref:olfactory receptor 49-like n=1 Tax=Acanthochromis polyacanthus TaxID=80966 RepID=UPI002233F59A|nr:olfactory receptor 49-like [Acanthochromis polyacanthus]